MSPCSLLSPTRKQLSFLTERTPLSIETYNCPRAQKKAAAECFNNGSAGGWILLRSALHLVSFPFRGKQMQLHNYTLILKATLRRRRMFILIHLFSWLCVSNMYVLHRKQSSFHYHIDKVRGMKICAEAIGIILPSPRSRLSWIG